MNDGFESYLYRIIVKFDEDNYLNIFIDNFKQLQDTLTSNYLTKKFSFFNNDIGIHQVKHIEVFVIQFILNYAHSFSKALEMNDFTLA